jgi:hypothetical protein
MITINDFHNYLGCVVTQADGDQGDSPQRTAMFYIGKWMLGEDDAEVRTQFANAAHLLREPNGWLVRDARPDGPWRDPHDVSRDQEDPWVIACSLYGLDWAVRNLVFRRWKRYGRYQNADVMNPETLAMDIRALGWWWLYPLLWVLDLWSLLGNIVDCVVAAWPGHYMKDGSWLDKDNTVTRNAFFVARYPTMISALAWCVTHLFFPKNIGGTGIRGALTNKHRAEANANPALADLWRSLV